MGQPQPINEDDFEAVFGDELEAGHQLMHGQYTIESFLNAGGFGITYRAKDSLDRAVVIKECFPGSFCRRTTTSVQARSRAHQRELASIVRLFVEEARSLAKLDHPNIVGVHQVFEENNTAYMALDFVEGRDLLDIIENPDDVLEPEQIETILRKLLDAVSFIHKQGVLHRDISPDNILLQPNMEPILIDFGAAREEAGKQSRVLSAMRVVKDGYSPQEFYISGAAQGAFSDLYALAATFYHLITGELPANSQNRLAAVAAGEPDPYKPVADRMPAYSDQFLNGIDTALAILPKDRIETAEAWLAMLDGTGAAAGAKIGGTPRGKTARKNPSKAAAAPAARGKQTKALLLGGAALLLPVIGGVILSQSGGSSDEATLAAPVTADSAAPTAAASSETDAAALSPNTQPTVLAPSAPSSGTPSGTGDTLSETSETLTGLFRSPVQVNTPPATASEAATEAATAAPETSQDDTPSAEPIAEQSPALQDAESTQVDNPAADASPLSPQTDAVAAAPAAVTPPAAPSIADVADHRFVAEPLPETLLANLQDASAAQQVVANPADDINAPGSAPVSAPEQTSVASPSVSTAPSVETVEDATDAITTAAAPQKSLRPAIRPATAPTNAPATTTEPGEAAALPGLTPETPDLTAQNDIPTTDLITQSLQADPAAPADAISAEVTTAAADAQVVPAAPADVPTAASDQTASWMELGREAAERLDISATPAATPSSQTVEVETFALRNVITGWSVDLEGALPAGAGTIFEINAVTIGSAASIDTVLHKNLAAPTGGTMEVAVLSGADPQDAILETVTAPVVQKTLFLNGTMFETRMIDGTWNTIVTATSPSQPWQVGDVLVGDLSTGTMFNQRTSLPVFLENAQIADRARLTVAVRRDGGVIPVDFSNPQ